METCTNYAWKQYVEQTGSKIRFYQSTPLEVKDGTVYIGRERLIGLTESEITLLEEYDDADPALLMKDTYAVREPLFDLTNDNRIYSYEDRKKGMIEAVNILHEYFGDKIPRSPEGDFYTYDELMEIIMR